MKPPPQIEFKVLFRLNQGYWVAVHCPQCGSSFSSGEWVDDVRVGMRTSVMSLNQHTKKYHFSLKVFRAARKKK
jgi:heterodisulfide reductase subunit B